jgi:hypothetical protein
VFFSCRSPYNELRKVRSWFCWVALRFMSLRMTGWSERAAAQAAAPEFRPGERVVVFQTGHPDNYL